jgi:hypothetical protein
MSTSVAWMPPPVATVWAALSAPPAARVRVWSGPEDCSHTKVAAPVGLIPTSLSLASWPDGETC